MLKSISLENYKCFKEKTDIGIAPLTVLCGVNSSGKSSILKSLLMLKQSYENNATKGQIVFTGNYTDNGTFSDVVYNNTGKYFKLSSSFILRNTQKDDYDKNTFLADKSNFKELSRIYKYVISKLPKSVDSFIISVEMNITGISEPRTRLQAIRNYIKEYIITIYLCNGENTLYKTNIDIHMETGGKYSIDFFSFPLISNTQNDYNVFSTQITDCYCYFDGIKIIKVYSDNAPKDYDMNNFLPNLYTIFAIISTQFYNIKHISPLRYFPTRSYTIINSIRDMSPSGENMSQILAQYGSNTIDFYDIDDNNQFTKTKKTLFEAVKRWASLLETGNLELIQNDELVKINVSGHNLIDVGVGVGQSTPILVEGLYTPKESTLLIEQPEIHLHPRAQMGMADFLLSLSLNRKNVIVETHSDHIINRLVKRIMLDKTGQLNKDIYIYFIDKDRQNPVERIKITPTKGIVEAPINFFTQFASESMDIAKIGFTNHKEGVSWICNE